LPTIEILPQLKKIKNFSTNFLKSLHNVTKFIITYMFWADVI